MEYRKCSDCGKSAYLPSPEDKANALIRDRCVDCIAVFQREEQARRERAQKVEVDGQEWFT
jgi:hypothetical protein